jgi:cycloartenol synthase
VFHVFLFIVHLIITAQTYVILSFVYAFPRKGTKSLLMQVQNKDGGWGLHIESPSTMFGSVLTYVTLRLLGEGLDSGDGAMEMARNWILDHGGATFTTSWAKFWLSVWGLCIIHFLSAALVTQM